MAEPEEESDQDDEPYLHPSLASSLTKIEAVCFDTVCMCFFLHITHYLFLKMHKQIPKALGKILCLEQFEMWKIL